VGQVLWYLIATWPYAAASKNPCRELYCLSGTPARPVVVNTDRILRRCDSGREPLGSMFINQASELILVTHGITYLISGYFYFVGTPGNI
jgi:hypothetical protein